MNKNKPREFWQKLLKINSTKAEIIVREIQCKRKETIDDRDKIHKINLECARRGTAKAVFDDVEKISSVLSGEFGKTPIYKAYQKMKREHLNSFNTDSKNKEGD